ncbi:hypothetical protein NMY22_g1102 [Coprinellus aureogranulatus]|nr:hypothetical protein NMY22_g1102 [Coprinellus aureogranulatus]
METKFTTYDLASSATSILLLNLMEQVSSGYPLAEAASTPAEIGTSKTALTRNLNAADPPPLFEEPSGLSQTSHTATCNISRSPSHTPFRRFQPHRNAQELKTILGSSTAKLKRDSSLPLSSTRHLDEPVLHLEGGNSRARVHLDMILENDTCVQGGYLNGLAMVTVRKTGDGPVMLSQGRMRVIGFECIMQEKERAVFYELGISLSSVCQNLDDLYESGPDEEGFMLASEGQFTFPFSLHIKSEGVTGVPKGYFPPHSGVAIRYIVMLSLRVKDPLSDGRSVAHFYRHIHVWPALDLAFCLTSLPRPIQVTMSGLEGALKFSLNLHRLQWFAGQHCHLRFHVLNKTSKPMKTLVVELYRDIITCRPRGDPALTDDFAEPETLTSSKLLSTSSLSAGDRAGKGYASAKGWWTGVRPEESLHFYYSLPIPPDALSVTKGPLLEIEYRIRATISSGTLLPTELSAEVPIRIINLVSVDPPPSGANTAPALIPSMNSTTSNRTLPGPPYSAIPSANTSPSLRRGESADLVRNLIVPPPMASHGSVPSRPDGRRFADLYYRDLHDGFVEHGIAEVSKGLTDRVPDKTPALNQAPEMNPLPTQSSVYSQATFRTNPGLAVTAAPVFNPSIPVGGVLPPSLSTTCVSNPDRTENELLDRPLQASLEVTRQAPLLRKLRSRKLPDPPSSTPSRDNVSMIAVDHTALPRPSLSPLQPRGTPPATPSGSRSTCSTASMPHSLGSVSVKDKIRALEQRVMAIESAATMPS